MMTPWMIIGYPEKGFSYHPCKARFGTRAEAEMHAQSLNKLSSTITYKVVFDDKAVLIA